MNETIYNLILTGLKNNWFIIEPKYGKFGELAAKSTDILADGQGAWFNELYNPKRGFSCGVKLLNSPEFQKAKKDFAEIIKKDLKWYFQF